MLPSRNGPPEVAYREACKTLGSQIPYPTSSWTVFLHFQTKMLHCLQVYTPGKGDSELKSVLAWPQGELCSDLATSTALPFPISGCNSMQGHASQGQVRFSIAALGPHPYLSREADEYLPVKCRLPLETAVAERKKKKYAKEVCFLLLLRLVCQALASQWQQDRLEISGKVATLRTLWERIRPEHRTSFQNLALLRSTEIIWSLPETSEAQALSYQYCSAVWSIQKSHMGTENTFTSCLLCNLFSQFYWIKTQRNL